MTDNLYLLDEKENPVGILSNRMPKACPYYDDIHTEQLDHGFLTFEFSVPVNHPTAARIVPDGYVIYPDEDSELQLFQIKRISHGRTGDEKRKALFCENAAVHDLLSEWVLPVTLNSYTLEQAMAYALQNTGWELGKTEYSGVRDFKFEEPVSALAAVHQIMDQFEAEIKFRVEFDGMRIKHRYIDVLQRRGQETGKMFSYGIDLQDEVERTDDTTELFTAVIGVGNADENGKLLTFKDYNPPADPKYEKVDNWVGSVEALQKYGKNGKHKKFLFKDDKATNAVELYNNSLKKLEEVSKPRVTYNIPVVLLEKLTGYESHRVRLGDTIAVNDTDLDITVKARVIEKKTSQCNPGQNSVVLGDFIPVFTAQNSLIQRLQSKIQQSEAKWNAASTNASEALSTAQTAQTTANNAQSTATNAQNTANTAQTTANNAQNTANSVKNIVDPWKHLSDTTKIDGGKIYTGSVTANQIAAQSISSSHISTAGLNANVIKSGKINTDQVSIGDSAGKVELTKDGVVVKGGAIKVYSTPDASDAGIIMKGNKIFTNFVRNPDFDTGPSSVTDWYMADFTGYDATNKLIFIDCNTTMPFTGVNQFIDVFHPRATFQALFRCYLIGGSTPKKVRFYLYCFDSSGNQTNLSKEEQLATFQEWHLFGQWNFRRILFGFASSFRSRCNTI
jgi:phage minor structural protein